MGMVVIQPYILVSKLKKIKTRLLRYTGYLYSIKLIKQYLLLILVLVRQLLTSYLTAVKNMLLSTAKRYMKDLVRIFYGVFKIQV